MIIKNTLAILLALEENKFKTFEPFIKKERSKIKSWQAPILSQAGKNTLLKFVASVILVHNMSVLKFPTKNFDTLDRIYCEFWWAIRK